MCDLRLFMPLLKLVEPEGNKEEKLVNSDIGLALGFSVHEFDEMKTPEVVKFRRNIFNCVSEIVQVWSPSVSVLNFMPFLFLGCSYFLLVLGGFIC